ncbi:cytochrome c oxidase subunit 1 [Tanacetum coccineum]|uniref:Cytochrome c oxidase subunit 1 n=1 Tax=Tanacetum coccineum TaxID=301880 RepID=A0ABQ5C4V2_9ASTR
MLSVVTEGVWLVPGTRVYEPDERHRWRFHPGHSTEAFSFQALPECGGNLLRPCTSGRPARGQGSDHWTNAGPLSEEGDWETTGARALDKPEVRHGHSGGAVDSDSAFSSLNLSGISSILGFHYWVGLSGMPRRIPDYPDAYAGWNALSSSGSYISVVGICRFFVVVAITSSSGNNKRCAPSPWAVEQNPTTPEWMVQSPPAFHTFGELPAIKETKSSVK